MECKGDGRIPKVAVFLKYCLPCREICVRWKSVIGRAVMAPREGWSNAFVRGKILRTWIDQSEDLQTPKRRIDSMAIVSYPHTFRFRFGAKETRHKGDGYYNHRFFIACVWGKSWTFRGFCGKVQPEGQAASRKACFWHIAKRKVGLLTIYLKKVQEIRQFWHAFVGQFATRL